MTIKASASSEMATVTYVHILRLIHLINLKIISAHNLTLSHFRSVRPSFANQLSVLSTNHLLLHFLQRRRSSYLFDVLSVDEPPSDDFLNIKIDSVDVRTLPVDAVHDADDHLSFGRLPVDVEDARTQLGLADGVATGQVYQEVRRIPFL